MHVNLLCGRRLKSIHWSRAAVLSYRPSLRPELLSHCFGATWVRFCSSVGPNWRICRQISRACSAALCQPSSRSIRESVILNAGNLCRHCDTIGFASSNVGLPDRWRFQHHCSLAKPARSKCSKQSNKPIGDWTPRLAQMPLPWQQWSAPQHFTWFH